MCILFIPPFSSLFNKKTTYPSIHPSIHSSFHPFVYPPTTHTSIHHPSNGIHTFIHPDPFTNNLYIIIIIVGQTYLGNIFISIFIFPIRMLWQQFNIPTESDWLMIIRYVMYMWYRIHMTCILRSHNMCKIPLQIWYVIFSYTYIYMYYIIHFLCFICIITHTNVL